METKTAKKADASSDSKDRNRPIGPFALEIRQAIRQQTNAIIWIFTAAMVIFVLLVKCLPEWHGWLDWFAHR